MEAKRIIKINSDGFTNETHITTDDGKEVDRVVSVYWSLDTHQRVAVANIEVVGVACYVKAQLDHVNLICPVCEFGMEHRCHDQNTSVFGRRSDGPASGDKD